MEIEIRGINIDLTEEVDKYIRKKLRKLDKYFQKEPSARIVLKEEEGRYIVQANVTTRGTGIYGEGVGRDLYTPIREASDKVIKQARKYKDKIKSRKRIESQRKEEILNISESSPNKVQPEITRTVKKISNSISLKEAVRQLSESDDKFLVFLNKSTNQIDVIFKREDKKFELIEPEIIKSNLQGG
ncbi:MAG: ribosome-associated translation inhibitor RaiA [Candidatus Aerophobetes bacterium]|nr:ribosome-associated translation inhibitor RaiA [Candidatus Aerophobetes bacterium]